MSITLDASELGRSIVDLARFLKKSIGETFFSEGRLICVEAAKYTQPFGLDENARAKGEKAVERDYKKIYKLPEPGRGVYTLVRALAKEYDKDKAPERLRSYLADGDTGKAREMLKDMKIRFRATPDKKLHQERWKNGKIQSGRFQLVINPQAWASYLNRLKRLVGWVKGGFAACADRLGGTRGLPQWVTRHKKKAPGRVIDRTNDETRPSITIINDAAYSSHVLSESAQKLIVNSREQTIRYRIENAVKHWKK